MPTPAWINPPCTPIIKKIRIERKLCRKLGYGRQHLVVDLAQVVGVTDRVQVCHLAPSLTQWLGGVFECEQNGIVSQILVFHRTKVGDIFL